MEEYKGIYFNEKKEQKFYEGGAHFKYRDLVRMLESIGGKSQMNINITTSTQNISSVKTLPKPKTRNVILNDSTNNNNNSNYNNGNINSSMANKTNTFLIQSKYIGNIFQKKNFSIEKQRSNMSTISMNPGIPHKYMPNIQKRKDILINLNSFNPNNSSTTNISNTISLKKHSLNNSSNSGITIVFPNRNISRNIRMKSVDYESNLKLLNQTEQRVKNKNETSYSFISLRGGTGARSIDVQRNNNKSNNNTNSLYKKNISYIREKSNPNKNKNGTKNKIMYNKNSITSNLYLKKITGDFYVKNTSRNKRDNYFNGINTIKVASHNMIKGRNIFMGNVNKNNNNIGHTIINERSGFTIKKNYGNIIYYN